MSTQHGTLDSTLQTAEVDAALAGTPFAGHLHTFASVTSTNTLAIAAAQAGTQTGVWVADEQTAGRGRGGHTWHSVAGEGLYVSILIRPRLAAPDILKISLAAGVAAADAIHQATSANISIRWPNDLMDPRSGKKLGGILTESALSGDGRLTYAVIGIGINLNQRTMPPELEAIATSLRISGLEVETRRETLLPVLLRALAREVSLLEQESSGEPLEPGILSRFERVSPIVRGARVHVAEQGGYTGVTEGLDPNGLLRVRADDGNQRLVRHGGVRTVQLDRAEV